MHSEFACHIGLRGKFFCHSCWVKGSNADNVGNILHLSARDLRQSSPALSSQGSEADVDCVAPSNIESTATSEALPDGSTSTQPSRRKRKKYEESYSAMLDRVSAFVKVCLIFQCQLPF